MQSPKRALVFASDDDSEPVPGLETGAETASAWTPAEGPTRAQDSKRGNRRSLISFAARAVEISSSPTLARSSSMASMSPSKSRASVPPKLTRGDSEAVLLRDQSGSQTTDGHRSAVARRSSSEDDALQAAIDSVPLRKRPRGQRRRALAEEPAAREFSPLSAEDDWDDEDIPADDQESANVVGDYLLGGELGKGTFGTVYKALHRVTGEFVAIKEITTHGTEDMTAVMGEVELLKRLDHPNIVQFKDMRRKQNKYYLALEYIENGSLKDVLTKFGHFPETLALVYVIQLLQGLSYLHDKDIIHRDIKGANILITKNGTCKLADFGLAAELRDRSVSDPAGSVYWMAPELFDVEGDESAGTSKASDVWSLGCTVIELVTGSPPYSELSSMAAIHAIVEDEHPPLPECSKGLISFLQACLKKSPAERMSTNDLLQHPWIARQTPQKSGDYRMLTRQLRDYRKTAKLDGAVPGGLRSVRSRRQSVSGLTKGNLRVRRLTNLTGKVQPGRLEERLRAAGVELTEEALHVINGQDATYEKLSGLASELHGDLVAAEDAAEELVRKRVEAECESARLMRTMETMRTKLKLLEEHFNQTDDVLARLVYGSLEMSHFTTNVKKGVLKVKKPHDKWRKRHVLLKDNFVLLFKPEDSNAPADVFWLDRVSIEPQSAKLVHEKFVFKLHSSKRSMLVCAASDSIMVSWMKALSFPTPWYEAEDFDSTVEEPPGTLPVVRSSGGAPQAHEKSLSPVITQRRTRAPSTPIQFEKGTGRGQAEDSAGPTLPDVSPRSSRRRAAKLLSIGSSRTVK